MENYDAILSLNRLRVPEQTHLALKEIARRESRSLVQQVRYYILQGVERDERNKTPAPHTL